MGLPAFQTLIDAHGRAVHRFLVSRVGAVDADDCYQETWISALRAYPELADDSHLRAWLMTIAYRKAIDHTRRRAVRAVPVDPSGALEDTPSTDRPVELAALGADPIWTHVAALPDKQRSAVALRFLGDLSHAEIGAAMGTSEDAARRNVHEGITRLRKDDLDDSR